MSNDPHGWSASVPRSRIAAWFVFACALGSEDSAHVGAIGMERVCAPLSNRRLKDNEGLEDWLGIGATGLALEPLVGNWSHWPEACLVPRSRTAA